MACESAYLRYIALTSLSSKRLEMVEDDGGIDNMYCTDKYIDEFDIINKFR